MDFKIDSRFLDSLVMGNQDCYDGDEGGTKGGEKHESDVR